MQWRLCSKGGQLFTLSVGATKTPVLDIFNKVGCLAATTESLEVTIAEGGPFVLSANPVGGGGPFISHMFVYEVPASSPPEKLPKSAKVVFSQFKKHLDYTKFVPDYVKPAFVIAKSSLNPKLYRHSITHKPSFRYTLPIANGIYSVRLGFMELFPNSCKIGRRVFRASANGKTTALSRKIDIFKGKGCRVPYDIFIPDVKVTRSKIVFAFSAVNEVGPGPIISNLEVGDFPIFADFSIDVGEDKAVSGARKVNFKGSIGSIPKGVPSSVFRNAREGKKFTYTLKDIPSGAYDITLGFVEAVPENCKEEARVFSVFVNDALSLEGYDIFAKAGCRKATLEKIEGISISSADVKPIKLQFVGIAGSAIVSFIKVNSAVGECVPESSSGELTADHGAHSVPGSYPPQRSAESPTSYVDRNGDGFVNVFIDGKDSHTHFADSANNINGRLTQYEWTIVETGKVLSRKESFFYNFPLGTTRLKLKVRDNSCSTDEAETTVTVTGKIQPGAYCYYYRGLSELPTGGTLAEAPLPTYAAVSKSLRFVFPKAMPFYNTKFVARCLFFLEHVPKTGPMDQPEDVTLTVLSRTGISRLYKGADLILDSETADTVSNSLAPGASAYELLYIRTDTSKDAVVVFKLNGKVPFNRFVSHDQSTVVPILSQLTPSTGKVQGGTRIKVTGFGLHDPLRVIFGAKKVSLVPTGQTSKQFFVLSPKAATSETVEVSLQTKTGQRSNALPFTYGSGKCDEVKFASSRTLFYQKDKAKANIDFIGQPSSIAMGPDGHLYMGTRSGVLHVLVYNADTLEAKSHCHSDIIKDPEFLNIKGDPFSREILGVTFNPTDTASIRPYVSTSSLYWFNKYKKVDNPSFWRNGAVDRLIVSKNPASFGIGAENAICLKYDKRIVSYLPVSNHDHSVNSLIFTQDGDLLITVGGLTNAGLPGYKLGATWEAQLSASILIAETSKGGAFNGKIEYTDPDVHYLAKMKTGSKAADVGFYATGVRNLFGVTMTAKGEIFGVDQGPNSCFGDASISCEDFNATRAEAWEDDFLNEVDVRGKQNVFPKQCKQSPGRRDKLLRIVKGKFYGHPNMQRSNKECAWIDPFFDKTGDGKNPPSNYKSPIQVLPTGGITGIVQYRSTHFCGKMAGRLVLSKYVGRPTYQVELGAKDKLITSAEQISNVGGIAIVEDHLGNLIMPVYSEKKFNVLRPVFKVSSSITAFGAAPLRHPKGGKSFLFVGGSNFAKGVKVYVGSLACTNVRVLTKSQLKCRVPARPSGRSRTVDVSVVYEGVTSTIPDALLYTT